MITIFAIPKPFKGHIEVTQRNAIDSWKRLNPNCEIILFGNEIGTAQVATELDLRHIPNIQCNEFGTPLVSDAFVQVQQIARNELICYTNADIILLKNVLSAVRRIQFKSFILVGRRWNLDINSRLDTNIVDYEDNLRESIKERGVLATPEGSDYFVFPRGTVSNIPPFAVGRPYWDNWLMSYALKKSIPLIDATQSTTVIHQNHDYSHLSYGDFSKSWESPESDRNFALTNGEGSHYNILHATHITTNIGVLISTELIKRIQGWNFRIKMVLKAILPTKVIDWYRHRREAMSRKKSSI